MQPLKRGAKLPKNVKNLTENLFGRLNSISFRWDFCLYASAERSGFYQGARGNAKTIQYKTIVVLLKNIFQVENRWIYLIITIKKYLDLLHNTYSELFDFIAYKCNPNDFTENGV